MEMPIIKPKDAKWWELEKKFTGRVVLHGLLHEITVRPGFLFDGASIPRVLWRVCGYPVQAPRVAAALLHDWLYASKLLTRAEADFVYANLLMQAGFGFWRSAAEWAALRLFGEEAWNSHGNADADAAEEHGCLYVGPLSKKRASNVNSNSAVNADDNNEED